MAKRKSKRKIYYNRLIATFIIFVVIVITLITMIKMVFFPSVYYNYNYNHLSDITSENLCPYDFNNLSLNPLYYEDENYYSVLGVDVSSHQKDIDWKKVREQGIEFAYIRLGYRGYTNGKIALDSYFETNYKEAKEAGLKVGVYFFSQAIDEKEAMEEAFFVLEHLISKEIDLPIVYDLEDIDYDEGRIKDTSNKQRTDNAMAFMQKVYENNYEGMIYTNLYWANEIFDLKQINHYDIWFAQYNEYPNLNNPYKIWQFTDDGHLEGIDYPVDLNIMFIEK